MQSSYLSKDLAVVDQTRLVMVSILLCFALSLCAVFVVAVAIYANFRLVYRKSAISSLPSIDRKRNADVLLIIRN